MSQISIKPQFKNFQFSYPEITNPFDEKYRRFRASLTISYYLDSDNTIFFTLYSDDYSLKILIEKVSDDWALTNPRFDRAKHYSRSEGPGFIYRVRPDGNYEAKLYYPFKSKNPEKLISKDIIIDCFYCQLTSKFFNEILVKEFNEFQEFQKLRTL